MSIVFLAMLMAAQADPAAAVPSKPAKERKVCRSEQRTGSQMSTTTCHTKAEWAEIDDVNHAQSDRLLELHRSNSPGS